MNYTLVNAPATEPVSSTEAKAFLRVTGTDEDTLITTLISTARQIVEKATGRALITQTWRLTMDAFPDSDRISLERWPVATVASLKYYPADGSAQVTWTASGNYLVNADSGILSLVNGVSWPSTIRRPDAVQIEFTAGAANAAAVAEELKHSVLLVISHLYENRAAVSMAGAPNEIPYSLRHLLESQRVGGWCA